MSRNFVFAQRGIRAVKLQQMTVSVFLHNIDTCVILIGDVIHVNTTGNWLILAGMKECQV